MVWLELVLYSQEAPFHSQTRPSLPAPWEKAGTQAERARFVKLSGRYLGIYCRGLLPFPLPKALSFSPQTWRPCGETDPAGLAGSAAFTLHVTMAPTSGRSWDSASLTTDTTGSCMGAERRASG